MTGWNESILKRFQCNESFEKEIQMEWLVYCKHEHVDRISPLKAKYVAVHFLRYNCAFKFNYRYKTKGWGQSAKLGQHSAIWGKLGTALQAYTLNPCTKFPPNPTSRKVNT